VDALYGTLTEGMTQRTTAEWLEILREADIPCGAANTLQDLMSNDYLRETGFFTQMQHPVDGKVVLPAIAAEFSATPPSVRRLWPTLGQHTEEVLREVGFSAPEIATITERG
jgi:crotonobetainyl-CoA:carnitine CoA-transferase CaiB-like acyl-CoA transferase